MKDADAPQKTNAQRADERNARHILFEQSAHENQRRDVDDDADEHRAEGRHGIDGERAHDKAVELFMNDPETEIIVMIGEIGGQLEVEAARWIKETGNKKPVVGFIAGETAPKGRTMGHAGAIVGGSEDTAEAKKRIMRECGIHVVDSPAKIGEKVKEVLK